MSRPTFTACPDCGSSHLGGRCGMTWLERLRGVSLDTRATPTRTRRKYYDQGSVNQLVGEGSRERYMDATKGKGAITKDDRGTYRHQVTGEKADLSKLFEHSPVIGGTG